MAQAPNTDLQSFSDNCPLALTFEAVIHVCLINQPYQWMASEITVGYPGLEESPHIPCWQLTTADACATRGSDAEKSGESAADGTMAGL